MYPRRHIVWQWLDYAKLSQALHHCRRHRLDQRRACLDRQTTLRFMRTTGQLIAQHLNESIHALIRRSEILDLCDCVQNRRVVLSKNAKALKIGQMAVRAPF
jgi:hypothetical protein